MMGDLPVYFARKQNISVDDLSYFDLSDHIATVLADKYDAACAESIAKALITEGCVTAMIFDKQWLSDAIKEKVERDAKADG